MIFASLTITFGLIESYLKKYKRFTKKTYNTKQANHLKTKTIERRIEI